MCRGFKESQYIGNMYRSVKTSAKIILTPVPKEGSRTCPTAKTASRGPSQGQGY